MLFPEIPSLNFPEMWCLKEICFDHYTCLITKMILEKKKENMGQSHYNIDNITM